MALGQDMTMCTRIQTSSAPAIQTPLLSALLNKRLRSFGAWVSCGRIIRVPSLSLGGYLALEFGFRISDFIKREASGQ